MNYFLLSSPPGAQLRTGRGEPGFQAVEETPLGPVELMFLKSTPGRMGNLMIPSPSLFGLYR